MNLGKWGEQLFEQAMIQQGYMVQNVSADPQYYYKGDFVITSPTTGDTKIFEVKTDSRINRTGNLYLEYWNIRSKNSNGWWNYCQADYIAYCDSHTQTFYIIPLLELRQRVSKLPQRTASCEEDSKGLLVSLNDIQDIVQGCIYV